MLHARSVPEATFWENSEKQRVSGSEALRLNKCTSDISHIYKYIYIYILTWNPNDPCFDWNVGLVLDWSRLKIEDKQVPGQYYSMYIYIYIYI